MNLGGHTTGGRQLADVDFFARDLVADYVHPGMSFLVMEGRRQVAEAEIISVHAEGS